MASERHSYTASTVTDLDALRAIVGEARNEGYAYAQEEYYAGDISVAAAVVNADGYPLGAVNVSVPFSRWNLEDARRQLAPKVINTARAIASATRSLRPVG